MNKKELRRKVDMLIGKVGRLSGNLLDKHFVQAGYNITREQWAVLQFLKDNEGVPQQALAEEFQKNKASITSLIDNLEKSNMVERKAHESDKRKKLLFLTKKGKGVQDELAEISVNTNKIITKGLDNDQLNVIDQSLTVMIDNIIAAYEEKK
ncbi:MarR family winged helix-turn-helix transcriptional regulator [Sediminitomix flava]|uniref:DNA-binding MarR family transcriptional regulator n=1 Tax=Sediminitomix flava TaxID=379075 RepID=A0A315Z604_SEDFL|nr:MarR family transcriptional regulator [Sediminitomix flava]PWJ39142.1 DNA-binding MarR family transcriptional regulator [Sediminitomix flava]